VSHSEYKKTKKSISTQFAAAYIILLIIVMAAGLFVNGVLLQKYYQDNKKHVLELAYARLDEIFEHDVEGTLADEEMVEFEEVCNVNNVSVIVVDSSLNVVISSVSNDDKLSQRLFSYIFKSDPNYLFKDNSEASEGAEDKEEPPAKPNGIFEKTLVDNGHYSIIISTDPRMRNEYMELMGTLDNGYMVMIRTAVKGMKVNATLATKLLFFVMAGAGLIGAVIICLISKRITRPILVLAELSQKMAQLDFEAKYTGDDDNEIGYLGKYMNRLSETLEKTITELKNANNELKDDLTKREQLDEMRAEFVSNVSHELKTPIAIIQGYAEGLKDCVNDDPESREYYCDVIVDEANRMNRMVKNLLTLNQLQYSDAINLERFDIAEMIRNYMTSANVLAEEAGAKIVLESPESPESLHVWGDEYNIEEVLMNYISNAIHHVSGDKIIKVSLEQKNDKVRVSVFNTGAGIPDEAISQVWEKFYKVDKARSREYGGSGIGLSIVKAIMQAHHQDFGVYNSEDGVTFYFELDMA